MSKISFILTNSGAITAFCNGKNYSFAKDHRNYDAVKKAIKEDNPEQLEQLANIVENIQSFAKNSIVIKDGEIYYKDELLHNNLTDRILELMKQELPFEPMLNFLENLMLNDSKRAVDELFNFLSHNSLPITDDGCFIAYKRVREDWKDFHTGTFDNAIGKTVKMPRNKVDDNKEKDCSDGLHVGTLEYVTQFHSNEGHVVIVKVNPKNAVSVPNHDTTKLRVCEYQVIDHYKEELIAPLYHQEVKPGSRSTYFECQDNFIEDELDEDELEKIEEAEEVLEAEEVNDWTPEQIAKWDEQSVEKWQQEFRN